VSRLLTAILAVAAIGVTVAFVLAITHLGPSGLASFRDRVGPSTFDSAASIVAALLLTGALFSVEARRLGASKEIAFVAMIVALGAAGRLLFAPAPNVSPVDWLTLCTGIVFGPVTGFTVGAATMLVSNFWLGQGPWTIYQMVGMGSLGLVGGALGSWKRLLGRNPLAALGVAWGFAYGAIMAVFWVFMVSSVLSWTSFLAYFISGLPFCLLQGTGNAIFLYALGPKTIMLLERFRQRQSVRFVEPSPGGVNVDL